MVQQVYASPICMKIYPGKHYQNFVIDPDTVRIKKAFEKNRYTQMKKITSRDVAKRAGVSQSAVSMILNNKSGISFTDETREKVFSIARELNYKSPSQANIGMEETGSVIAVFIPTISNPYYSQMAEIIERKVKKKGYKTIICNTLREKEQENFYLEFCKRNHVTGIIFTFVPTFPALVEQLSLSIPIILIAEKKDNLMLPSLELNNSTTGTVIVEHLYGLGHRRIALVATPLKNMSITRSQRIAGIREKMAFYGNECVLSEYIAESGSENTNDDIPFEYSTGYALTKKLLKEKADVSALIGINDMTALGIIAALQEQGFNVPRDYSVCGFDNIFYSVLSVPKLTTIDYHLNLRVESAVDYIINTRAGLKPFHQVNKIEYQPKIIVRESTALFRGSAP